MSNVDAPGSRRLIPSELLAALDLVPAVELTEELLPHVRAAIADPSTFPAAALTAEQAAVRREQRFAPGLNGAPDVRLLVYTPPGKAERLRPAYLYIHGGGYVLGTPEMMDGASRGIAAALGCVIVAVDYRLAPETVFPGAVEDCYAALGWLHRHADELGVDRDRIAIGGESAGAGHAAALAIFARDRGEYPICMQMLDAPMLDDRTGSTAAPHPYCGEFAWTAAQNRFGWRALLGREPGGPDVPSEAVPARAISLAGLPPAFISVGSIDLFFEESLEYARRLTRAGVRTEVYVVPGGIHGYRLAGPQSELVRTSTQLFLQALARGFNEPAAP